MEKSEATLWREFRNGDRKAFERLLNLYYVSLFEYGSKFQPDDDKLRDALHNLMLSLWERRQFLNDTENLKLYLFKAVRNQIFREKAEPFAIRSITAEEEDQFTSDGNYAERTIIETELLQEKESKISAVMSRLSKRQQEVLHLKFYENLTNDQIAGYAGYQPTGRCQPPVSVAESLPSLLAGGDSSTFSFNYN